jgi:hypothetical protein
MRESRPSNNGRDVRLSLLWSARAEISAALSALLYLPRLVRSDSISTDLAIERRMIEKDKVVIEEEKCKDWIQRDRNSRKRARKVWVGGGRQDGAGTGSLRDFVWGCGQQKQWGKGKSGVYF